MCNKSRRTILNSKPQAGIYKFYTATLRVCCRIQKARGDNAKQTVTHLYKCKLQRVTGIWQDVANCVAAGHLGFSVMDFSCIHQDNADRSLHDHSVIFVSSFILVSPFLLRKWHFHQYWWITLTDLTDIHIIKKQKTYLLYHYFNVSLIFFSIRKGSLKPSILSLVTELNIEQAHISWQSLFSIYKYFSIVELDFIISSP